jgi:ABC-type nitrate/sulfonate/bicarbonate transport system permease component
MIEPACRDQRQAYACVRLVVFRLPIENSLLRSLRIAVASGALAYVAGEVIGRAIGGRAIEQLEAPDTISTVFD